MPVPDEGCLLRAAQTGRPSGAFRRPAARTGGAEGAARRGPRRVRRVEVQELRRSRRRGDGKRDSRRSDSGSRSASFAAFGSPRRGPTSGSRTTCTTRPPTGSGLAVSRALDIPYVVAEASVAAKQRDGHVGDRIRELDRGHRGRRRDDLLQSGRRRRRSAICAVPRGRMNSCRRSSTSRRSPRLPRLPAPTWSQSRPAVAADHRGDDAARREARFVSAACRRAGADRLRRLGARRSWATVPRAAEVDAAFARFDALQIRRVGFQDAAAIAAWLRASDIFVWPAIDEAFGMAFIEAQACGLPVVAGNGGGVASVVAAERTGVLVPLGDAAAFAAAISRLVHDTATAEANGRLKPSPMCARGTTFPRRRRASTPCCAGCAPSMRPACAPVKRAATAAMIVAFLRHGSTDVERGRPHAGPPRHSVERRRPRRSRSVAAACAREAASRPDRRRGTRARCGAPSKRRRSCRVPRRSASPR